MDPGRSQSSDRHPRGRASTGRAPPLSRSPLYLQPVYEARLDDLDLDLFTRTYLPAAVAPDVLAENERSVAHQLQSFRFIDNAGTPTVLGILVLGIDPRSFIPGAYIQFLRLDGDLLTDPILDAREIGGALPDLLQRLDDLLDVNNSTTVLVPQTGTDVRHPDYPNMALQQILRNAILHRTYEGSNAPVRIHWFKAEWKYGALVDRLVRSRITTLEARDSPIIEIRTWLQR